MPVKQWGVAVTTAPRPIPTLHTTLTSLTRAGWSDYQVFVDLGKNAWRNWIDSLGILLVRYPTADAYLMIQDDVVFCRNLREYLEASLWPADEKVGLCSVFTPSHFRASSIGWHRIDRGWYLCAAQAWALPAESAQDMVNDLSTVEAKRHIDAHVGRWARQEGRSVWYHTPSLAQHVADGNSSLGYSSKPHLRVADDFVGEEHSL